MSLFKQDAAILHDISAAGTDLALPGSIDCDHVFPDAQAAAAFALAAQPAGFATSIVEVDRNDNPSDVTAAQEMMPSCKNIASVAQPLDILAGAHRGRADGWGLFGD